LPVNYVWQDKAITKLFQKEEIWLVDCGSRGDISPELRKISKSVNLIGFDADPENNPPATTLKTSIIYDLFLGEKTGSIPFHVYKRPWESSSLAPDKDFQKYFSSGSKIEKTLNVSTRPLDEVLAEFHPEISIDYLKLDVQGTELSILRGASRVLKESIMLELEIGFKQQYVNQDM
jgi:FkbM family methyltransferase